MLHKLIKMLLWFFAPQKYGRKYHPCIKCKWCELEDKYKEQVTAWSPLGSQRKYFLEASPESKQYYYHCMKPLKQVERDILTGKSISYYKPVNKSLGSFRIPMHRTDCGYRGKYWEEKDE